MDKKSTLQQIKVAEAYESATNTRGDKGSDAAFKDLVASVKEKGVLVPVIARPKQKGGKKYEVVAGNRRLRAAIAAGLKEIPARVQELSDEEAQEVQIIENLQREDVHPLEEGEAYRKLVEESHQGIASIGAKVGKSESYVRQRLFLTNLSPAAASAYRSGKVPDGHAVVIARMAPADQGIVLTEIFENPWRMKSLRDLEKWISEKFHTSLEIQPWLKDKEIAKIVGPCKECPPNRPTLFGAVKEGQCTSVKCWARKMQLYTDHLRKKNPKLVPISKEYGTAPKGVLSRSNYESVSAKSKCASAEEGIVVLGQGVSSRIWICRNQKCKKHHYSFTPYEASPKEKAARKAAIERQEKKAKREAKALERAMQKKVKWPMGKKSLAALFEICLHENGTDTIRPIVKFKGWKVDRKKARWGGGTELDYDGAVRREYAKMSDEKKLQLIFEIFLSGMYEKGKIIKLL